jgi:hypothetical protein
MSAINRGTMEKEQFRTKYSVDNNFNARRRNGLTDEDESMLAKLKKDMVDVEAIIRKKIDDIEGGMK